MKKPTKEQLRADIANLYATIRWYQGQLGTIQKSHTDQEIQINTRDRAIDSLKAELLAKKGQLKARTQAGSVAIESVHDNYGKRIAALNRSVKELREYGELREADLQFIDHELSVISGKLEGSKQANIGWKKQNGRLADTIGKLRRNEQRADDAIKTNEQLLSRIVALDMNRDDTDVVQRLNEALAKERKETIRLDRALARVCEQRDEYMRQRDIQETLKADAQTRQRLVHQDIRDRDAINAAAQANLADAVHAKQTAVKARDENSRYVTAANAEIHSKQKRIGRLNAELSRMEKISGVKDDHIGRINDSIVERNREIKGLKEKITELAKTIVKINEIARYVL